MAPFITPSSRCATCSVRSTRVPIGVLNVSVNWLSSDDGKNSLPILKYSGIVEAHSPTITSTVASRCRSSTRSSRAYAWSMRSSPRAMLPIIPRRVSRSCAGGLSQYIHKSGVTVRETKKLIISAKLIVIASGINKLRATPDRNSTGKNTTMVVMVDTKIGIATSCAASSTAVLRDFCSPRWRWMFSSSTMLSSTSRPTPSASPPSVNTFSVCPAKYSRINVATIDSGIATATMPVARRLSKKIRITTIANRPPWMASCSSDFTAARMYED